MKVNNEPVICFNCKETISFDDINDNWLCPNCKGNMWIES